MKEKLLLEVILCIFRP